MTTQRIGILGNDTIQNAGLADACRNEPAIDLVALESANQVPADLDAVIVNVAQADRESVVSTIAKTTDARILATMPVGCTRDECGSLIEQIGTERVASLNPLMFDPSITRITSQFADDSDLVRTMFTTWRRKAGHPWRQDLAQLLDLARIITDGEPTRISPLPHQSLAMLLALIRYENGAVLSLEVGELLPDSSPNEVELLIECFGQETAFQFSPGRQALTLDGASTSRIAWSANPYVPMLTTFLDWVRSGGSPSRGLADDLAVLAICDACLDQVAVQKGNR